MTSKDRAIHITIRNLHNIFGEINEHARLNELSELWVTNPYFIDPLGVFTSHKEISDMAAKIQAMGSGEDVFSKIGDPDVLFYDESKDMWVTRLKWGTGPPGSEKFNVTGEDVVTIVGGKIERLYTFLDKKEVK